MFEFNIIQHRYKTSTAIDYNGGYVIGNTNNIGMGYPSFVRLYEQNSGTLLRQEKTNTDGSYLFLDLNKGFKYFVTAHDPFQKYNAVIQDNIEPK